MADNRFLKSNNELDHKQKNFIKYKKKRTFSSVLIVILVLFGAGMTFYHFSSSADIVEHGNASTSPNIVHDTIYKTNDKKIEVYEKEIAQLKKQIELLKGNTKSNSTVQNLMAERDTAYATLKNIETTLLAIYDAESMLMVKSGNGNMDYIEKLLQIKQVMETNRARLDSLQNALEQSGKNNQRLNDEITSLQEEIARLNRELIQKTDDLKRANKEIEVLRNNF